MRAVFHKILSRVAFHDKKRLLLAVVLWSSSQGVAAQPSWLTVHVDNDLLYGTDREYTGGFKFKLSRDEFEFNRSIFKGVDDFLTPFNLIPFSDQIELSVEAFTLTKLAENDRIVHVLNEAWTHVDLRRFYRSKQYNTSVGLSFGWLGPNSPGRYLQDDLHKLIGNSKVDGWDHHLPDQPTAQLNVDWSAVKWKSNDWSLYQSAWLKVGSPNTQAYLGAGLIRKKNIDPVFLNNQLSYVRSESPTLGYFYFGSIGVSYLAYSALIDGRILGGDKPILNRYHWIPAVEYGIGFSYGDFAMTLSGNAIGQVYRLQPEESFHFASVTMTWVF